MTTEDERRARDRQRVWSRRQGKGWKLGLFWLLVGHGILVILGEDEAPSMRSYAATGAQFGSGFFLPFVALTFGMPSVVQELTVRLGAVRAVRRGATATP